nr:ribonuclease H-like domain-containing protein [Tanacetum cinerariifolium]
MTNQRPAKHVVNKPHSLIKRPINHRPAPKKSNFHQKVTAVKTKKVIVVQGFNGNWGNPQQALKDKGVIDSGCSRHMTGNLSYLSNFEEINGGYVAFGGNPKGGKITGKDTECVVLSSDFKLPNENHTLLRVLRENNMYNFCGMKEIKIEFSVARTPQQNRVAERKNRTLIEAARTMLADSLLSIPFWVEAVNISCYVQNRVLVTKPHNKTPYELLLSKTPSIGFMRPFGCPVTILNTLNPLRKFDGNADEGFLVGYSVSIKAFRVFNRSGPKWLFDIDTLTRSMNYQPVVVENQPNHNAGNQGDFNVDHQNSDVDVAFDVKDNEEKSYRLKIDVKSAFLYGTIREEVYVCQPLGFEDIDYPDKVYKVIKALYGLHQAPRACLTYGISASTPIDTEKPLLTDPVGEDVDVHIYRLIITVVSYTLMLFDLTKDVVHLMLLDLVKNAIMLWVSANVSGAMMSVVTIRRAKLKCMSAKRTAWNEFSSSMASAVICLATVMINAQIDDLSSHNTKYTSPVLTQKVFVNMRRIGKVFLGVETPLFDTMLVQPQVQDVAEVEEDEDDEALKIVKLKQRVRKLENKRRSKSSGLKRLRKVGTLQRVESLNDTVVDAQEDASNQEGGIAKLDADKDVTVEVNATEPTVLDDEEVTMIMDQTLIKMKAKKQRILDEQMAKRLQDEEIEQAAAREKHEKEDLERAKVLQQQYNQKQKNIDWNIVAEQMQEKHLDNIKKYQSLKWKPISIAQARKNMIVYLKNIVGYKIQHFKDRDEEPTKKRAAKKTLLQESFKKLRPEVKVSGSSSTQQDTPTVDPTEIFKEDVQNMLQIVSMAEFKVEALQVKYHLIDWEIYSE